NVIVPKGAGGPTDTAARILLKYAQEYDSKLNFVVENVTGANGVTGMTKGALAKADGYTLSMIVVELGIMQNLPSYNCAVSTADFRPVSICTANTVMLCTRAGEYEDIYDFVDKMTADTKVGNSGTYGISDLGFKSAAQGWNKEYTAVPYADGDSASIAALLADSSEVDAIACCASGTLTAQVEAGAIDVLCVFSDQVQSFCPDSPLLKDLNEGYAVDADVNVWCGVAVPAETPDDIYNYLVEVFTYATESEAFQKELNESGTIPAAINGADAAEMVDGDAAYYAELLADEG
ncbi:tripartite tricarboxylate transporter substrate-binding protein, partial [Dysosmobacter sp.]|uniref:tripartite tricarboxylate transporter substrate-binding protein n=1 Tax=Dysosmobacter sp. TaxID=2591382 RepID=UPI003AB84CDC